MRRRLHRGSIMVETALFLPLLFLLFLGAVELTRATYTYYTLKKILYNLARYAGTQQGINFCDENDSTLAAAKAFALTGNPDGSGDPLVGGLSPENISIRLERYQPETAGFVECACEASALGCDSSAGARPPDSIVVYLREGYSIQFRIIGLPFDPILLRPQVRVPFGGA
jgi:hypothetical protein